MRSRRQRKIITWLFLGILIVVIGLSVDFVIHRYSSNRSMAFRTEGNQLQILRDKKWREFIAKGVYLGPGNPQNFSAESNVSKKDYANWFRQLAAMNANVIRIHTVQAPDFYKAFFEYNILANKPLYLLHGIRLREESIERYDNAYDSSLNSDFLEEIRWTIDVIHGKASTANNYNLNVAPYVMGYIFSGKNDPGFVITTNEKNTHLMGFEGDYLFTVNASPYEAWLAALANYAVSYEQEKYGGPCRLVSWINCPDADPVKYFDQSNENSDTDEFSEPDMKNDTGLIVDIEHIRSTEKFNTGFFASYYIYPEFPDSVRFLQGNVSSMASEGRLNPYEAYLRELKNHHSMPVLAVEFGIEASAMEGDQGQAIADMFDSMINFGFAGGILYNRQDEWFNGSVKTEGNSPDGFRSYAILQKKFAEY